MNLKQCLFKIKTVMRIAVIAALVSSLFGCSSKKMIDGDGMVYVDSEHRTVYANEIGVFEEADGEKYWAVCFLGYGDAGKENREKRINELFSSLSESQRGNIHHYDFEGDEWYLIVPRHKTMNDIIPLYDNGSSVLVADGNAFTVKCNVSDIHPNIRIMQDSFGGVEFSPCLDGKGNLSCTEYVIDITN